MIITFAVLLAGMLTGLYGFVSLQQDLGEQSVRLAKVQRQMSVLLIDEGPAKNVIDPYDATFGETYGGMTLFSIGPLPDIQSPFGYNNAFAKFRGKVTLRGTISYYHDDFFGADKVCVSITEPAGLAMLPSFVAQDAVHDVFCIKNTQDAAVALGSKYGSMEANITIDDYEIRHAATEVSNMARFIGLE